MQAVSERQICPDVSPRQRVSAELVKQTRKLRWFGMQAEADRLVVSAACIRGWCWAPIGRCLTSQNIPRRIYYRTTAELYLPS